MLFLASHLKKLRKYHYAIKDNDKLILDRRLYERSDIWNRITNYVSTTFSDYSIGFWSYTNDAIAYNTNMYMSKYDFENFVEKVISRAAF